MQKKTASHLEPIEVPEVVEFLDAQNAIEAFKEEHGPVFAQLAELTERYNTTLEQADKACRSKEVSCGPFNLYQFTTKYDAEALFNAIGRDQFLAVGGKMDVVTTYAVDRGRLEACIAQSKVPSEVVEHVRKEIPNFHKPDKLVIP
jgi:hypothetical protein